jgi:hypothetical protein
MDSGKYFVKQKELQYKNMMYTLLQEGTITVNRYDLHIALLIHRIA